MYACMYLYTLSGFHAMYICYYEILECLHIADYYLCFILILSFFHYWDETPPRKMFIFSLNLADTVSHVFVMYMSVNNMQLAASLISVRSLVCLCG